MVDTLLQLDATRFDRIIIETTGIADPLPIFQSLAFHPILANTYAPAEVLTVYDCLRGENLLTQNEEAEKQLAIADVIFLTKHDLGGDKKAAQTTIEKYNRTALILDEADDMSPELISQRSIKPSDKTHSHRSEFSSLLLETTQMLDIKTVAGLLHHLSNAIGQNLLRIKGFVKVEEHPAQPLLVQVSGQIVHDFEKHEHWMFENRNTQLVVIAKNTNPKMIQTIFDAFIGNTAIDTPDRNAVMDNPLSIPGFEV